MTIEQAIIELKENCKGNIEARIMGIQALERILHKCDSCEYFVRSSIKEWQGNCARFDEFITVDIDHHCKEWREDKNEND